MVQWPKNTKILTKLLYGVKFGETAHPSRLQISSRIAYLTSLIPSKTRQNCRISRSKLGFLSKKLYHFFQTVLCTSVMAEVPAYSDGRSRYDHLILMRTNA